jgi:hypothetical protein
VTTAQRKALQLLAEADGWLWPINGNTGNALETRGWAETRYIGGGSFSYRITPAGREALAKDDA